MPDFSCIRLTLMFLLATAALAAGDASAQRLPYQAVQSGSASVDRERAQAAHQNRHARTAEQRALSAAVRRVGTQTGGQVLSAESVPFDGRDVSRIKVVDANGRVRVYMDDPQAPPDRQIRPEDRSPTRDDDN